LQQPTGRTVKPIHDRQCVDQVTHVYIRKEGL
jgi:hypothetical protein